MSHPKRRRSSAHITLVLIGAASVTSCGDPVPDMAKRDVYQSRAHCVQDWGEEKRCDAITSGTHRGYWYGPSYTIGTDGSTNPPRAATARQGDRSTTTSGVTAARQGGQSSRAVDTHSVSRSGFGSSASSHSSGS